MLLTSSLLLALSCSLQTVTNLQADHRNGQTFLTWDEIATPDVEYRVYRSTTSAIGSGQLAAADQLGRVDQDSSLNARRTKAEGDIQDRHWIIQTGAAELRSDQGLFVYTTEATGPAWYAVTTIVNQVENTTIVAGVNATINSVSETPAAALPVLQASLGGASLYAHWGGNRDTPFQASFSLLPSQGFNFLFLPGTRAGDRGLLLRLHAAGKTYAIGFPNRTAVPADIDLLATDDDFPFLLWSFWLGGRDSLPSPVVSPGDTVVKVTMRRTKWTLDWVAANLVVSHDPERVYVAGGSMGAMGSMLMAGEYPDTFAAILCRNGNFDFSASDINNSDFMDRIFGTQADALLTDDGLPLYSRTNADYMMKLDPGQDWPVIRTINGKLDPVVGWESAVQLYDALEETFRPAANYFDQREHNPMGYWQPLEGALLRRTFEQSRDEAVLRFSDYSLDDDYGNGDPMDGDDIGAVNGSIDWQRGTVQEANDSVEFSFSLRSELELDDAPIGATASVRLTPRRMSSFVIGAQDIVRFTSTDAGVLCDEHLLFPDAFNRVTTPPTPIDDRVHRARFERWTLPTSPYLFCGDAPLPGDSFQYVIFGNAGDSWMVAYSLSTGSMNTTCGLFLLGAPVTCLDTGTLDATGIADRSFDLPANPALSGTPVYLQADVNCQLTNREDIVIR